MTEDQIIICVTLLVLFLAFTMAGSAEMRPPFRKSRVFKESVFREKGD